MVKRMNPLRGLTPRFLFDKDIQQALKKKINYIKISGDKAPSQTTRHGEDHKLEGRSHVQKAV